MDTETITRPAETLPELDPAFLEILTPPLTLSEAIRRGARRKRQAFYAYRDHGKTCAIGAAIEGTWPGIRRIPRGVLGMLSDQFGIDLENIESSDAARFHATLIQRLNPSDSVPPMRLFVGADLARSIICLNDRFKLSREQIADLLAASGL